MPRPAAGTDLLRARACLALLVGQPGGAPPADLLPGPGLEPGDGWTITLTTERIARGQSP